jgi:hypothetical protein
MKIFGVHGGDRRRELVIKLVNFSANPLKLKNALRWKFINLSCKNEIFLTKSPK